MQTSRRQFISCSAIGGLGLFGTPLLALNPSRTDTMALSLASEPDEKPAVASTSRFYRFSPVDNSQADSSAWIQIDLGNSRTIHAIRLHPAENPAPLDDDARVHFCVDGSDCSTFDTRTSLDSWHARRFTDVENFIVRCPATPVAARYLRLEAMHLGDAHSAGLDLQPGNVPAMRGPAVGPEKAFSPLRLARIEIFSGKDTLSVDVTRPSDLHRRFRLPPGEA